MSTEETKGVLLFPFNDDLGRSLVMWEVLPDEDRFRLKRTFMWVHNREKQSDLLSKNSMNTQRLIKISLVEEDK